MRDAEQSNEPRILFVDDEPRVLEGYSRALRRTVRFESAQSGAQALQCLEQTGPYAVVVSDMQMPEMSGLELFTVIRERFPETVRIMLTGDTGQKTAVDAVNEGDIFRFLSKPCTPEKIATALAAGVKQHGLIVAERDLLERTVRGSVEALTNVLSLANPRAFGRTGRLKQLAGGIARQMQLDDVWQFETLAMLSQIGYASLSPEILDKVFEGGVLSVSEQAELAACPELGARIVASIPRLEEIAESIRLHERDFDSSPTLSPAHRSKQIPLGARILRAVLDYERIEMRDLGPSRCMDELIAKSDSYDPEVLDALRLVVSKEAQGEVREVAIGELQDGMMLMDNIISSLGVVLVCKNNETTESVRRRLRGFAEKGQLSSKFRVRIVAQPENPEAGLAA